MIATGLRTLLAEHGPLGVIVGQRVFVNYAPQKAAAPYVVLTVTAEDPLPAFDGTDGLAFTDFDIDCYATDYPGAEQLAGLISDFLKDYTGPAGPSDTIEAVLWNNRTDGFTPFGDGRDGGLHFVTLDLQIQHD